MFEQIQHQAYVPDDYFVVLASDAYWYVSARMARYIESRLDRFPRPRWIAFVDVFGARVRVRSDLVEAVHQSYRDQRAASRAFRDARQAECGE